ncbi:hypothetical protein PS2_037626 [Malus domestica]
MMREVGKNFSRNALFILSQDVTVPGANSYNQSLALSIKENGKAFIFKILPSMVTGVMLEHTTSNSFKCLFDPPWTAHGTLECGGANLTLTRTLRFYLEQPWDIGYTMVRHYPNPKR